MKLLTRLFPLVAILFTLQATAQQLSPCGEPIPASQSREVQLQGISCGATEAMGYSRSYEPISPQIESKWIELQNTGSPDNREERQKLRYIDAKMRSPAPSDAEESIVPPAPTTLGRYPTEDQPSA